MSLPTEAMLTLRTLYYSPDLPRNSSTLLKHLPFPDLYCIHLKTSKAVKILEASFINGQSRIIEKYKQWDQISLDLKPGSAVSGCRLRQAI